jgi:AbrB family looped-hinge helix DNA binding protein
MQTSTVTSKGQITIPKEIRRALGIRQGSRVSFAQKAGKIELRVVHHAPEIVVSGFGMLDARGKRLPADFDAASLLVRREPRLKGAS